MDVVSSNDGAASKIAAAIGEPARARILYCLMDNRARTSTELAAIADIGTSTASAHLHHLLKIRLLRVEAEGRHRYYSLAGPEVGLVLEGLSGLAGAIRTKFVPSTPDFLRTARSCYDHIAGSLGVRLHDRLIEQNWITRSDKRNDYAITRQGWGKLMSIGITEDVVSNRRRRCAYGCLDWSERRFHIGGALGAALLALALKRKWLIRDLDGRGLNPTSFGQRELRRHFDITFS